MQFSKMIGTVGEADHHVDHCVAWTDEERSEIIEETNRILADPAFKNSKRCLALFRCLVDRSLANEHDGIKERTLGVEVFGRAPDYDTAIDPIVRMTANEIRKRLAQWYDEPAHHQRVRVRLIAGAYLLKFEFAQPELASEILETKTEAEATGPVLLPEAETQSLYQAVTRAIPEDDTQPEVVAPPLAATARSRDKWTWGVAAIVVLALAVVLTLRHFDVFQSRDYLVWQPLLNSTEPLFISISDEHPPVLPYGSLDWQLSIDAIASRVAPVGTSPRITDNVTPMVDAKESQRITRWLAFHGRKSELRGFSALPLQDLHKGPLVLIGGYNPWSLMLLSNLRYSIRVDRTTDAKWIQDAQNASKRTWIIDGNDQPQDIDYAIISRFLDPETGHWILALGGLRQQGTQAASDLLVESSLAQLLPAQIRSKGNFQIVLKTHIVDGSEGPPQVLAFYTW